MRNLCFRYILLILLAFNPILLIGCTPAVIGVGFGVGIGAAAYSSGELSKIYKADYHEAVDASKNTLKRLKIPQLETISDELKTEIKAKRPNGTPITVEAERIDRNHTEITVRTGTIGIWEKHVSRQIHEYIEASLTPQSRKKDRITKNDSAKQKKIYAKKSVKEKVELKNKTPKLPTKSRSKENVLTSESSSLFSQNGKSLTNLRIVIVFQQDSNRLQKKTVEKLNDFASLIDKNPDAQIKITGFPDSSGSIPYKKMISERRAKIVKLYLVEKGMDPIRGKTIVSSSVGELPNQGAEIELLLSEKQQK